MYEQSLAALIREAERRELLVRLEKSQREHPGVRAYGARARRRRASARPRALLGRLPAPIARSA